MTAHGSDFGVLGRLALLMVFAALIVGPFLLLRKHGTGARVVFAALIVRPFLLLRKHRTVARAAGAMVGLVLAVVGGLLVVLLTAPPSQLREIAAAEQVAESQRRSTIMMAQARAELARTRAGRDDEQETSDISISREYRVEEADEASEGDQADDDEAIAEPNRSGRTGRPHPALSPRAPRAPVVPPSVASPPSWPQRIESGHGLHRSLVKICGLVVLIMLAYLFIDAGRRPRYTWLWRVGIAVLFLAVCGLLAQTRYAM